MAASAVYGSVQELSLLCGGSVPPEFVRSVQDQPGAAVFCHGGPPDGPVEEEAPPVVDMSQPGCGERDRGKLAILSNGRYKAGIHRATVNKDRTRMSWPVFFHAPREIVIGPHQQLVTGDTPAKYKTKKYSDYEYCKINLLPQ